MYKNQVACYNILKQQKVMPRRDLFIYMLSMYDYFTDKEGSAKELMYNSDINTQQFTNDKWCMVKSVLVEKLHTESKKQHRVSNVGSIS